MCHIKKILYILIFIFPIFICHSMEDKKQELEQESLSKLSAERNDLIKDQILQMFENNKDLPQLELLKLFANQFPKQAMEVIESNREALSRFGPYDPEKNFNYDSQCYMAESQDKDYMKMDYGIGIPPDEGLNMEDTLLLEQRRLSTEAYLLEKFLIEKYGENYKQIILGIDR